MSVKTQLIMHLKYYIFDLDNTLVKTNKANNNSYHEAIHTVMDEDVHIRKKRFTRMDLSWAFPQLSSFQISEITRLKELYYVNHIHETVLNIQLVKCLKLLNNDGCETILLTESRRKRAQQICDYYALTHLFSKKCCFEDYNGKTKYQHLETLNVSLKSIVLFENDQMEIRRAVQNGISENQIITIKF